MQTKIAKKIFQIAAFITIIALMPFSVLAQVNPGFTPNKLIDDKIFSDTQTFGGREGIQKFLEVKNSVLANTSPDFVAKLKEPEISFLKESLGDPRPSFGRSRTAAELIWDASIQSGLNPQVIIVTLNKEQGLITAAQNYAPERLQKALDRAMGFDCPDNSGCGNLFPGFYYQLFGNYDSSNNRYLGAAKSLMKSFLTIGGRGPMVGGQIAKVGDTIQIENTQGEPYNAPASQAVTLLNNATAALYRYTPHVFNGNYNFWKYFNEWFRYPNGTLVAIAGNIATYIIQNGTKQLVPNFVASNRNINLSSKVTISPTEFESYPTDIVYGPSDNTVVKNTEDGKTYLFLSNVKHPVSAFVLSQRGLGKVATLNISSAEASLFNTGPILPPKDGSIIKGQTQPAVYLVDNGAIKLLSSFTFSQRKIALSKIVLIPDDEIATYEQKGFVAPLDGTLIKTSASQAVYLVENGQKKPLTAELFKNRSLSFSNIKTISSDEVNALSLGAFANPKEKTYFAVGSKTGPLYIFKDGAKHPISSFVAKQRGITPDYVFNSDVANTWFDSIPIPPRDNTLIKGDSDGTVYLVSIGQLRPLTATAFKNRKYSFKNVKLLPQTEVDAYAKGDTIVK